MPDARRSWRGGASRPHGLRRHAAGWLAGLLVAWLMAPVAAGTVDGADPGGAPPEAWKQYVRQWMERTYGPANIKLHCWPFVLGKGREAQRYCMKVESHHWGPPAADGEPTRLYLLATGWPVDQRGESLPTHALPALAGAFVLERQGRDWKVLAADARLPLGSAASPPAQWEFIDAGPALHGWRAVYGDCHQGYCEQRVALLVPRGPRVVDVGFVVGFDGTGACNTDDCEANAMALELQFQADESKPATPFYALTASLQGRYGGKPVSRRFSVPFDAAKWRYAFPRDPALKELMELH